MRISIILLLTAAAAFICFAAPSEARSCSRENAAMGRASRVYYFFVRSGSRDAARRKKLRAEVTRLGKIAQDCNNNRHTANVKRLRAAQKKREAAKARLRHVPIKKVDPCKQLKNVVNHYNYLHRSTYNRVFRRTRSKYRARDAVRKYKGKKARAFRAYKACRDRLKPKRKLSRREECEPYYNYYQELSKAYTRIRTYYVNRGFNNAYINPRVKKRSARVHRAFLMNRDCMWHGPKHVKRKYGPMENRPGRTYVVKKVRWGKVVRYSISICNGKKRARDREQGNYWRQYFQLKNRHGASYARYRMQRMQKIIKDLDKRYKHCLKKLKEINDKKKRKNPNHKAEKVVSLAQCKRLQRTADLLNMHWNNRYFSYRRRGLPGHWIISRFRSQYNAARSARAKQSKCFAAYNRQKASGSW